jgi:hypothetical protein
VVGVAAGAVAVAPGAVVAATGVGVAVVTGGAVFVGCEAGGAVVGTGVAGVLEHAMATATVTTAIPHHRGFLIFPPVRSERLGAVRD